MYDKHLVTFLTIADSGSFMKAAEKMFVSPTAVAKQMNLLEERFGIKLFSRSKQGLSLTDAGKLVYDEAKEFISRSDMVLQKARELASPPNTVIRVGTSMMHTSSLFMEQWDKLADKYPNITVDIVPFQDGLDVYPSILKGLGKTIDIIPAMLGAAHYDGSCSSFHMFQTPFRIAVPKTHRLASRSRLSVPDLYGETVLVPKSGFSKSANSLRNDFALNHPRIRLYEMDYSKHSIFNIFNTACTNGFFIMYADCWSNLPSKMLALPIDWDISYSYGFVYSKEPSKKVRQFVSIMEQAKRAETGR